MPFFKHKASMSKNQIYDQLLAVGLGIASLILYVVTLAPSLLNGDSAEFQTLAYTLGIGHPTGYPVYLLIAKLFTLIPIGDIAYRVNLLSAASAALTVSMVFQIIRQLGGKRFPAGLGACTLGMAPLFWRYAVIAEIYTIAAGFITMIISLVLAWKKHGNPILLFLAGLLGGLGLGVHAPIILCAPAILLYMAVSCRKRADWFSAGAGVLSGGLLFLLAFLYLDRIDAPSGYYNSVVRPSLSVWGVSQADFDAPFERLKFLSLPPQFTGAFFSVPAREVWKRLAEFLSSTAWLNLFSLAGVGSLSFSNRLSRRWRETVLLLVAYGSYLVFSISYDVADYLVFAIPCLGFLCVLAGLGLDGILGWISSFPRMPVEILEVINFLLVVIGLLLAAPKLSYAVVNQRPPFLRDWEINHYIYPDFHRRQAEQLLTHLEDDAIVFTNWGQLYTLYFVAHIEQRRLGMAFHETKPQRGAPLADSLISYIEANLDARPIYFTNRPMELATRYRFLPSGPDLWRILRK